ncbi:MULTISPECIES: esterase [unclassified Brenneria]|uniref:esterase n=1 Tax=unclassified Brenneria TaxID=2634434 RepID=UPI0018F0D4DE|nr:esterase [Brenneria sp. L3-3C-1]MBJ7223701.1 esterase [Brenneria sp. L3-3C-1]MEE3644943.1 esterase [Brenneria sp. L3_3C_1]
MVEISLDTVNGIDVLHAAPGGKHSVPLPTIFFFHGYLSSKEVYSYFGYALAEAGFRVILPDAAMHGARFDGDEARRLRHFWDILQSNVHELPGYVDAYRQRGLIANERIGVCGASLGGMSALGCMARYPWISAVAAFMGSGYFSTLSRALYPPATAGEKGTEEILQQLSATLAEYDVSSRLDALADRPLLLWHGDADDVVPAQESARLYQALKAGRQDRNLTYLTEAGVTHRITPAALQAGVDFFRRHLTE